MSLELPSLENLVVTLSVGAARTLVEASATIVAGIFAAAYLRTLATPEAVASLFRGDGARGLLRTTLLGMALPVCAIGVLPVLRELRRLGLPTPKLLTFGLAAPLLNPVTLVYGLSVLSFAHFLLIVAATLLVSLVVFDVTDRFAVAEEADATPRPRGLTAATRLWNLAVAAGNVATGWIAADFVVAVAASAVVASLLPAGFFEYLAANSNTAGPAEAAVLSGPQYVSPASGVLQLSSIARVYLSLATGLVVYVFGVGLCGSTAVWLTVWYGPRRVAALGLASVMLLLAATYGSGGLLPEPLGDEEETHGLDMLTRPHQPEYAFFAKAVKYGLSFTDPVMRGGAVLLVACATIGLLSRGLGWGYREDDEVPVDTSRLSRAVPLSQILAVAVAGMAVFVGLVTFIFFPDPGESLEEMRSLQADAVVAMRQEKRGWALERLAAWDSVAAKLPVGSAIRLSLPTPAQREATRALRESLLKARDRVLRGEIAEAARDSDELLLLQQALRQAYMGDPS